MIEKVGGVVFGRVAMSRVVLCAVFGGCRFQKRSAVYEHIKDVY